MVARFKMASKMVFIFHSIFSKMIIRKWVRLINDSLRRNMAQGRQTTFKRSQWAIKNMGCCLQSEVTIANRRVTVAPSMHQVRTLAFPCILDISGQIQEDQRKGHRQCHHSPEYLSTMILSNDTRYGSHLAGYQLSIFQILIEDVSEGQLVVGRTKMIYHVTSNSLIHGIGAPHVSA
jgi:hypothetical protein